jgi:hypothetical protein
MINKKNFFIFFPILFYCSNANAYLDPGSGGIILQAIFGAIAGVLTFYYFLKQKLINFFKKFKNIIRGKTNKSKD